MPKRILNLTLDIARKYNLSKFEVKQFDSITLVIKMLNNGIDYTVANTTAKFYVGVANEMYAQSGNISISGNTVTVNVDKNMISKNGAAYGEIELTDSDGTVTSTTFIFKIVDKIGEGATIPGNVEGFTEKYQKMIEEFKKNSTDALNHFYSSTDGLVNGIKDDYESLHQIIIDENQAANLQSQINKTNSKLDTKANKDSVFSMANMGQDVKEAMTGGSVAVVGKDTILTENIVDKQVTPSKASFISQNIINICPITQDNFSWTVNNPAITFNHGNFNVTTTGMSNMFFKCTVEIGNTYSVGVKGVNLGNVRVYGSDKTTEIIRASLDNEGYYNCTFVPSETVVYLRFWIADNTSAYTTYVGVFKSAEYIIKHTFSNILVPQENVFSNTVKNVGKVEAEKLFATETWVKIDDETVNLPYDSTSTITIKKDITLNRKYAILFSGIIRDVKTINSSTGTWTNVGTVTNNVGIITIVNACSSLQLITGSSGVNKVYCVDITNNAELESFVLKYGISAINCDYKSEVYKKILELSTTPSISSTDNTWLNKKWIAYGDSITEQNSYTTKVSKKLGLKMINKGIGGTTVSDITGNNTNAFCRDERINTFDTDADLVTIMGGTNDWDKTTIGNLNYNNGFDTTKFMGALATTIVKIQSRCPNATIVVCSLIGGRYTASGVNGNIPIADQFRQTSLDFAKATREVAEFMNVEYCDTWSCGINNWNRIDMIEDFVHPTQTKGTDKIAIKLLGTLKSIEPLI